MAYETLKEAQNKPGIVYKENDPYSLYAEDWNKARENLEFLKNNLGGGTFNPNTIGPFTQQGAPDYGYLDENTGLIWQEFDSGNSFNLDSALLYASYLGEDGLTIEETLQNIWRIPTIKELSSVIDYSTYEPASSLPNFNTGYYMTTTLLANSSLDMWGFDLAYGAIYQFMTGDYMAVRCVR